MFIRVHPWLILALALILSPAAPAQGLKAAAIYTNSPSYTSNFVAAATPVRANAIIVHNSSGADAWLHLFDSTTNKLDGTAAEFPPILIPSTSPTGSWDLGLYNLPMQRGLVVAMSTTDRALTNVSASFKFTVIYSK